MFDTYSITKLSPDEGLSQGSNYFKFEDSKGFMWLTCNDAMNRFDGKTVKVYNLDKFFDKCPNLQQGYGFAEDNDANIYIGSVRGLYIYHRKQDQFTLQKIFNNSQDAIAMPIGFKDGKIWCFNKEFQLATYDVKTKKAALVTQLKLQPLKTIHIYEMTDNNYYLHFPFMDNNGNLWFPNTYEIASFDTKKSNLWFPLSEYFAKNKPIIYSSAYNATYNSLYFGTDVGLFEYNLNQNSIREIKDEAISYGKVSNIATSNNLISFRTDSKFYFKNNATNEIKTTIINNKNNYNRVFYFSFDKSKRLWICDDGRGQLIFDFKPNLLPKIPDQNTEFNYFDLSGVTRFTQLNESEIIIPNIIQNKNLLVIFNLKTHKMTDMPFPLISVGVLGNYNCATDTIRKGIWVFCENKINNAIQLSVSFLNQKKQFVNYLLEKSHEERGAIQDIQVLPNGKILCAFTKGLYWLQPETKSLVKINNINQNNLFKINVLDSNTIAISSINNDMVLYQMDSDYNLHKTKNILSGVQSFYIQKDAKRNQYWVATNQGIFLLNKNFESIKTFNANNKLAGTYIYGLLLDEKGNVYCSHQHGISGIDATTFQVTNYDKKDGIQDWDFNNRAFYKATDGTLFFGGVAGFNYFKPPLIPKSFYQPMVYIDEIIINSKQFLPNINADFIKKINLDFNQNNISINAFVKDLANADARELIYRFKGMNSKWKHLENGRSINFANLAPNNYTLQLGYYDKYAHKEVFQKTVSISISAPFYYKIWFWSLLVFMVSASLFYLYNRREIAFQQREFQQQLALEKQRNKITADLHDDIGATLSSLQINSAVANQLINNNPIEAQKVLTKIENQSQNLADKIGDIIWSMKPGKDEFMTLSSRIKTFANDILGSTNINYKIKIDKKIDTVVKDITLRKNIVLLLKEAINNVAKYSQANNLKVDLQLIENTIRIYVSDDGIGFDTAHIKGNGIGNMQKRVAELNGTFKITSSNNLGTSIEATIPCP